MSHLNVTNRDAIRRGGSQTLPKRRPGIKIDMRHQPRRITIMPNMYRGETRGRVWNPPLRLDGGRLGACPLFRMIAQN